MRCEQDEAGWVGAGCERGAPWHRSTELQGSGCWVGLLVGGLEGLEGLDEGSRSR